MGVEQKQARRILIASANPLFAKGLHRLFAGRNGAPAPEMRLVASMDETVRALEDWQPDLVVVDYDDRAINRAEFLNHFVSTDAPMQVMLVSLQASGEVVVYDRRTLTPDQAQDWITHVDGNPVQKISSPRASFFTWKWLLLTALVLAVLAAFIRLGFWQLDRLAQRRAYNARVEAQLKMPPLDLNHGIQNPSSLPAMQYRSAVVTGQYDPSQEVVLSNQVWNNNQLGVHLLTPLQIQGTGYSVLVDRGWIPDSDATAAARSKYIPHGAVTVRGMLLDTQPPRSIFGIQSVSASGARQDFWNTVDLDAIRKHTGLNLLPVYLQAAPDLSQTGLPHAAVPVISLDEGPHLGYAIQWFLFALTLAILYPIFVRRQLRPRDTTASTRKPIAGTGTANRKHA